MKHTVYISLTLCWSIVLCCYATKPKRPNIVILMADDLGYGDVGIFGNTTLRTPNIDSIARQGVRLTHHLAAASVCTPSRSAFLTGRYPIRFGMAPREGVQRVFLHTGSTAGLPSSEITVAEIAKKAGYKTALIGKWHLGFNKNHRGDHIHGPLNQGFDYYYGLPLSNIQDFGETAEPVVFSAIPSIGYMVLGYSLAGLLFLYALYRFGFLWRWLFLLVSISSGLLVLWVFISVCALGPLNSFMVRNNEVVQMPLTYEHMTQNLVQEGQEFIERCVRDDQPFLLFMSWLQVHSYLHTSKEFAGKSAHGKYGDNVEEMDWSVGEILKTLGVTGIKDNTLVYFTSDNGPHVEDMTEEGEKEGGYSGIFKGGKFQGGMEGGIRMPTAVMWPGVIKPNQELDEPTSQMDVMPTVANILRVPQPLDRVIDGHDLLPLLSGKQNVTSHEFMFHYCRSEIHAIRYRPRQGSEVWKLRFATPNYIAGTQGCEWMCECTGPSITRHETPLLFNMNNDPSESHPLDTTKPELQQIVNIMVDAAEAHTASLGSASSQFTFFNVLWRPWLQPYCNFPHFKCKDEKFTKKSLRL